MYVCITESHQTKARRMRPTLYPNQKIVFYNFNCAHEVYNLTLSYYNSLLYLTNANNHVVQSGNTKRNKKRERNIENLGL